MYAKCKFQRQQRTRPYERHGDVSGKKKKKKKNNNKKKKTQQQLKEQRIEPAFLGFPGQHANYRSTAAPAT